MKKTFQENPLIRRESQNVKDRGILLVLLDLYVLFL